jgi:hypothetical protein
MKKFTLEELAKHHEATGSKVSEYVAASDYDALKAERDALAAQVELTNKKIESCMFYRWSSDIKDALRKIVELTPQQHLAEIRAEAGRAGFIAGTKLLIGDRETNADQYAEAIRQGGAK